ncbi:MAG: hypothetical protein IT290_05440 [Deltaproteobacteria bacterium]|nr:hypothetical protein [Deltaproteobacteria bacterium]
MAKLTTVSPTSSSEMIPFRHDNVFTRERTTGSDRLVVGPRTNHVRVLLDLASTWKGDYWLLYILAVSRTGHPAARYQTPVTLDFEELTEFFDSFGTFLEADGRHHLWVGSADQEGILVYDRHDIIYAYGALDEYEARLAQRGFRMGEAKVPQTHEHQISSENDAQEGRILSYWEWLSVPLKPGDDD